MNLKKLTRIILLVAVLLVLSIVPVNAVVFNAAFDSDFYVNCYPDLKAAFGNDANAAYNHYLTYGIKEGRIASPVFDAKAYIRNYPDLQAAFGDDYVAAYNHFLTNGMNEGRLASDSFNVQVYIANYPDLQAAFGNDVAGAYNHYLNYGMAEGRVCGALEAGAEAPEDHVHTWEISKVLIAASCVSDGEAVYTCECGETKTDAIPASEEYHDYQEVASGVANVKIYKCTICNDTYSEVATDEEHEHEYAELEDDKIEPTCTTEGKAFKQCTVCGDIVTETLPKIDHTSSVPEGQGKITEGVVDCSKDGAEEVTCDVCREKFIRPISAHKFEKVSETAATCTAEGVVTYKCKACGTTKVETSEKIEHTYTSEVVVTPATCENDGLKLKVCTVCGEEKRTVAKKLDHQGSATKGWANVDEKGNYILKDESGNFDSSLITETDVADCEHDVIEAFECDTCNKIQVKVVAKKLGHRVDTTKPVTIGTIEYKNGAPVVGDDGYIVVKKDAKADCTHDEVKVFTCANCDEEKVVVITEKLAHTPLAGSEKVFGATCEEDGYKTYTCTTCNEKITEETGEKNLGHNYEYKAETCTTDGIVKCSRCDSSYNETQIKALVPESATGKNDNDQPVITLIDEALTKAKIKHDGANSTWTLGSKKGHNPIGEAREDGKKYCSTCGEWVTVGAVNPPSTTHTHATDLTGKSLVEVTPNTTYKIADCGVAGCTGIENISWDGSAPDGNKLSKGSTAPAHVHATDLTGKTLVAVTPNTTYKIADCGEADCTGIENISWNGSAPTVEIDGATYSVDTSGNLTAKQ